jgi:hypothetical protein
MREGMRVKVDGALGKVKRKPGRDFSLRRPTASQERIGKKNRPATLEMTVRVNQVLEIGC